LEFGVLELLKAKSLSKKGKEEMFVKLSSGEEVKVKVFYDTVTTTLPLQDANGKAIFCRRTVVECNYRDRLIVCQAVCNPLLDRFTRRKGRSIALSRLLKVLSHDGGMSKEDRTLIAKKVMSDVWGRTNGE